MTNELKQSHSNIHAELPHIQKSDEHDLNLRVISNDKPTHSGWINNTGCCPERRASTIRRWHQDTCMNKRDCDKKPKVTIMENVSSILDVVKKNILIYYCVIDIKVWSFMSHEPLIIILLLLIIIFIIFSNRSLYTFHMFLAFYQLVALPANAVCCFYQTWNKAYRLSYHLIWVCLLVHTLLIYSLAQEHSANQL